MATITALRSGTTSITNDNTNQPITAIGDITKAILFVSYSIDSAAANEQYVKAELTSTTNINFSRNTTSASTMTIAWYVVEFSAGVTVQAANKTIDVITTDETLSTASPLATSFTLFTNETFGSSIGDDDLGRRELTSTTNLQWVYQKGPGGSSHIGNYQVVDYDNCAVQRGLIAVEGATTNETLDNAVDLDKTFVLVNCKVIADDSKLEPDKASIRAKLTSTTNLQITKSSATPDLSVSYEVVEFTDNEVVQRGDSTMGTTTTVDNIDITAVDLTKAVAFVSYEQRGGSSDYSGDDVYGNAWVTAELTSTTNLRLTRAVHDSATLDCHWYVVEFDDGAGAALVKIINETVNISEGANKIIGLVKNVNETLNISESLNRVIGLVRNINETANISEANNRIMSLVRLVNETLQIT